MATTLKLRYYGDPALRKVTKQIKEVGPAERFLIQEMVRAMYEFDGSGLAACQVGIDQQICVIDAGDGPFAVINPEVIKKSREEGWMEEGCLSLPKVRINVRRPSEIKVRYLDESGRKVERTLKGLLARIFQHECDHLFARLIIDYATKAELAQFKDQLARLESLSKKAVTAGV